MKKLILIIAILGIILALQEDEKGDRAWFDSAGYCVYDGEEWVME